MKDTSPKLPPSVKTQCAGKCPPEEPTWAIPAGLLNTLWHDCYPRLVAKWWLDPSSTISLDAADPLVDPAELAKDLALPPAVAGVVGQPGEQAARQAVTAADRGLIGSPKFESRRDGVVHYLTGGKGDLPPVRFLPGGGFDFVMSDAGLDLFAPDPPETLLELLRFYSFRRTGRTAIGLPFYMADGTSAIGVDSPTGPSQAWIDADAVIKVIEDAENADPDCLAHAVRCVMQAATRPEAFDPVGPLGHDRRAELSSVVTAQAVQCLLEPLRCWQISGAFYRGIHAELPRVVATIWLEQASNIAAEPGTYSDTIDFPNVGAQKGSGLREILEGRLESSTPATMDFEFHPAQVPAAWAANWVANDLMITNRGFYFPPIKSLFGEKADAGDPEMAAPGAATADDALTAMIESIGLGNAGNPVFTDSMRTN